MAEQQNLLNQSMVGIQTLFRNKQQMLCSILWNVFIAVRMT